ncbi:uncharacterized protein [Arachis hypogaea]|uniref:uncharacterized protein n=1 Tax=Arachis hypogaea TaxID=3818 RepID=UPI003B225185
MSYKGVDKAQKAKLQSLRREYERYEMSSSETVKQYFTRVTDLVNKMRVYGEDMPDSKVVEKILRTMPMKYDHVVTTILESHDMDTMTIAELQGTMESHINRILEKSEKSTEEALKSREEVERILGLSTEEEVEAIFIKKEPISTAFIVESMDIKQQIADSNNHMSGRKELFSSLDDSVKLLLKFGNSTKIPIEGKGHIPIRLKDGSLSYISDVFYAPELDYNLLSMGQLSEKGYKMITYRGYCTVFDNNGRFIDKAKMTSNRMFPLKIQHVNPSCMSSVILDDNWLWHMQFGHFHFSGLNYLSRKGLVSGLPGFIFPIVFVRFVN